MIHDSNFISGIDGSFPKIDLSYYPGTLKILDGTEIDPIQITNFSTKILMLTKKFVPQFFVNS